MFDFNSFFFRKTNLVKITIGYFHFSKHNAHYKYILFVGRSESTLMCFCVVNIEILWISRAKNNGRSTSTISKEDRELFLFFPPLDGSILTIPTQDLCLINNINLDWTLVQTRGRLFYHSRLKMDLDNYCKAG